MKEITAKIGGVEYPLYYNGYAMYALRDVIGEAKIYDVLTDDSAEGFETLCEIAAVLVEQGELNRRCMGLDKSRIPSAAVLRVTMRPAELLEVRKAVMNAVLDGMRTEEDEDADIDLGLQEIESKRKKKG